MTRIFLAMLALCFAVGAGARAQTAPASPGLSAPSIQFAGCGAASAPGPTVDGKLKSLPISLTECGAKGDTVSFTDGTMGAGSNTLTSASRACNGALDPGKQFMLHGSGVSGAPQSGTIVSCSGASFVLSFSAVNATPWSGAWGASPNVVQSGAGSYAPGDTLTTAGGTGVISNGVFSITTTQAASAVVNAGGSGGANGACTVQGTTGTGTKFQFSGTVASGVLSGALTLVAGGSYTANPLISAAPVAPLVGCAGLTGATLTIKTGPLLVANTAPGQWTSMPSPNSVTTSGSGTGATLNLVGFQAGGYFTFGTDDTVAFANAVAAGVATGKQVYAPQGGYWLASQTTCVPLNNVTLSGDGWPSDNFPYLGGSMLLISNASTSAFCGMASMAMRDLAIYYPLQDGSSVSPVVYPPTFESNVFVDDSFTHNRFLNAYQLFKVDASGAGSGWGRVYFSNNYGYCVDRCFWWLNGAADTIQLDATNNFGLGGMGPLSLAGPANLARYSEASGAFAVVDVGSATYKTIDGFLMTGGIVGDERYGLRILSGNVGVSNFANVNWDQVASVLSVEGSAGINAAPFSGGEIYSINVFNAAQAADVFSITSSAKATDLSIGGNMNVSYAQGNIVSDANSGLNSLSIQGGHFDNFGQSSTIANYAAIKLSSSAYLDINGVQTKCSGGSTTYFLSDGGFSVGVVANNVLNGCSYGITDTRNSPAGSIRLANNVSVNTGIISLLVSGSAATLFDSGNVWDKPPLPALTSGWGAGASMATTSNDNFARISVGTAPSSPAVLTFNFAKPMAPFCTAVDETTSLNLTAVATVSAATVTGPKAAGDVVSVTCRYN